MATPANNNTSLVSTVQSKSQQLSIEELKTSGRGDPSMKRLENNRVQVPKKTESLSSASEIEIQQRQLKLRYPQVPRSQLAPFTLN